jgi:hypothetical protein
MTEKFFNVSFITDRVIVSTTVEADDDTEAHDKALEEVRGYLGLDLIPVRYQIEVERV